MKNSFVSIRPGSVVLLILLFAAVPALRSAAQELYRPERRFQLQFYTGYESVTNEDAHYAVTTGGTLDYSTVGTRVVIDQVARTHMNTVGVRLGMQEIRERSNFRHNLLLDFATNAFIGPVYMVRTGAVYEPEFRRERSPLGAFIGLAAGISHFWGTIGEVGGNGDRYFETPPGDVFPEGSTIRMRSNVLPYAAVSFGARLYFGRYDNLFAIAGYRFSHAADIWHYRISDPEDTEYTWDFPDSPFPRSPEPMDQDGTFFRIGITIVAREE